METQYHLLIGALHSLQDSSESVFFHNVSTSGDLIELTTWGVVALIGSIIMVEEPVNRG